MQATLLDKLNEVLKSIDVILPEICIAVLVLGLVIFDLAFPTEKRKARAVFAAIGLVLVSIPVFQDLYSESLAGFQGTVVVTPVNSLLKLVFILSALVAIWFNESSFYVRVKGEGNGEYYTLLLSTLVGLNLMVMSRNLLVLFLGLELVGMCSFALTIFLNHNKGKEAAVKYLLYGVFASAIMLYGMSWLYGFNKTLSFDLVNTQEVPYLLGIGIILFSVGALFKLSGFPFHVWVPDVYEGGPFPVISFFSMAPKVAGLGVLFVMIESNFPNIQTFLIGNLTFERFLSAVAILTISVGNFAALRQSNVKRLMGYSSIAHAGFLLIAIVSGLEFGLESFLFYVITYVFVNFAAFVTVYQVVRVAGSENIQDFSGVGKKYPFLGVMLLLSMVALIGLPPTSGFLGKLYLFTSLYEVWASSKHTILLVVFIVGLFNTVVSLFYYLKIPFFMFFKESKTEGYLKINIVDQIILVLIVLPLILQFIFAEWFIEFIEEISNLSNYII